jgi:hypothetical protein
LILICLEEEEKMSDAFEKHVDRRISEMRERMRIYRLKKKVDIKTFETTCQKGVQKYQ